MGRLTNCDPQQPPQNHVNVCGFWRPAESPHVALAFPHGKKSFVSHPRLVTTAQRARPAGAAAQHSQSHGDTSAPFAPVFSLKACWRPQKFARYILGKVLFCERFLSLGGPKPSQQCLPQKKTLDRRFQLMMCLQRSQRQPVSDNRSIRSSIYVPTSSADPGGWGPRHGAACLRTILTTYGEVVIPRMCTPVPSLPPCRVLWAAASALCEELAASFLWSCSLLYSSSQGVHSVGVLRPTAVLPKIPHSNSSKRVPNRPLRPRRGRFGTLLQQLECGIFGRTAVVK